MLAEVDFNLLSDARANRVGLMGDRDLDDPAPRGGATDEETAWKLREYRPPRASWEWFRQHQCACPVCCAQIDPLTHCSGVYRDASRKGEEDRRQTRWHALVECKRGEEHGELDELRMRASAWLVRHVEDFDVDAQLALRALQSGGEGLSRSERWLALRFMLGTPLTLYPPW